MSKYNILYEYNILNITNWNSQNIIILIWYPENVANIVSLIRIAYNAFVKFDNVYKSMCLSVPAFDFLPTISSWDNMTHKGELNAWNLFFNMMRTWEVENKVRRENENEIKELTVKEGIEWWTIWRTAISLNYSYWFS